MTLTPDLKKKLGVLAVVLVAVGAYYLLVVRKNIDQASSGMEILSPAFSEGGKIPAKYTCDGDGTLPPLVISGVPSGAKSLALIVEDPDTARGTFIHWVTYNVDPAVTVVAEGVAPHGMVGKNGTGQTGFIGPCPPTGSHRYIFRLYALDSLIDTAPGPLDANELKGAMRDHTLAETSTTGTYEKSAQ